jgi:hypothetical protein
VVGEREQLAGFLSVGDRVVVEQVPDGALDAGA